MVEAFFSMLVLTDFFEPGSSAVLDAFATTAENNTSEAADLAGPYRAIVEASLSHGGDSGALNLVVERDN